MQSQLRRYAFLLADKHLRELPAEELIKAAPSHYGTELNDSHRLWMWNGLLDHYLAMDPHELLAKVNRHLRDGEPILKAYSFEQLEPEVQQLVDSIVDALWNSKNYTVDSSKE